jgi:hypothetical protein
MPARRPALLTALLGASFALAATAQAAPEPVDPCALLSAVEVSAALGRPVEAGRYADNGVTRDGARSTTCLWAVNLPPGVAPDPTKSLGGREFAILNVIAWPGGPSDARKFLDGFRTAFSHGEISSQPVDIKIGADEALWWGDGVAARLGSVSIGMSVASGGDRALRRPRAERLARLVVQRLPRRSP